MANWFGKFNSRTRFGSRSSPFRTLGDEARDRRDWAAAASAYASHVADHPDDLPIWIQLGHAHKEAGDYDSAMEAYQQVRKATPADPDLLLNLGHLYKLMGDAPRACQAYAASAAIDGNSAAQEEYASLAVTVPITRVVKEVLVEKGSETIAYLRPRCHGVRPTLASDLTVLGDTLQSASNDPWVEFEPTGRIPVATRAAELLMTIDGPLPEEGMTTKIYLDYGDGYSETRSIVFPTKVGDVRLQLVFPRFIKRMRWDPDTGPCQFSVESIILSPLSSLAAATASLRASERPEVEIAGALVALEQAFAADAPTESLADWLQLPLKPNFHMGLDYDWWREMYIDPKPDDYRRITRMTAALSYKPKFSFVVPTYDTDPALLVECIESMLKQTYTNFEICISDDNSPNEEVRTILSRYADKHDNIKVTFRRRNGHISANSNSAIALASGDYIVLVDHDDIIPDYSLFVVAYYLNQHPEAQVIFSDEDKVSANGDRRFDPYFKSAFSRFLLYGHNMVSHLGIYKKSLVDQLGGFRLGLEGSQDYDLALRCHDIVGDEGFLHIPHILYHWRTIPGSTSLSADQKSYAVIAAEMAINGHFERTNRPLRSVNGLAPGLTAVKPAFELDTFVSIIIPTRDGLDVLRPCIDAIAARHPSSIEILIVDNGSQDPQMLAYLESLKDHAYIRVLRYDQPFNFSEINNFAVRHAKGEIICFLNDDTEVVSTDWLNHARTLLSMPDVGVVGARLMFPDGNLQHFGIGLGIGRHRVAGTPHGGTPGDHFGYFGKARLMQEFSAVTAACMFVRKADFERLGGFDPSLRVAYNDVDLCLRFREDNLRVLCDPEIELIHKESRTRGSDKTEENRARLNIEAAMMRERWGHQLDNDPFISPNHSLARTDFALAWPPRVPVPWRMEGTSPGRLA
ncbi:hypothetical protein ASE75_02605 [Sphingomonas sp. Leaf17]|uniref:glycosyltransferase n=1 Tax=Sphingomonas sp. Leaf17 TaxID=1735683 RepID=UPI0006F89B77|nr:glycosyltransferase [Sphingomonas sp. Leaf17]KQM67807.1 hypothetical protein ASE75_02605 [Sphingomonas sp. Leaf17]